MQGYCFPSGWCYLERSVVLEKDGFCSMRNDWAQGFWWLFLQLFSIAINLGLFSSLSSPLWPPSARAQGEWLQMKFCALVLYEAVWVSIFLSMADRNSAAFHSWMLSGFLPSLLCCRLGSSVQSLDTTLLRGNPLNTEISLWNFSCYPWESNQSSCASSALPISLIVVKWFLLSGRGYKASLQLVFSL